MSIPAYIYKILPASAAPPDPIPNELPVSDLDKNDGFIHLSTALQLPGTLERFFADHERVHILRIIYKDVEGSIKWENSKGTGGIGEEGFFPHLHNGLRLGKGEIESVAEWEKESGWNIAVEKAKSESWFVY